MITDFAVEFITQAAAGEKPFFLYVSHFAPHWPLHAKPEDNDLAKQHPERVEAMAGTFGQWRQRTPD